MVTRVRCIACHAVLVSDQLIRPGKRLRCPKCGTSFLASEPESGPTAAPSAAAAPTGTPEPALAAPEPLPPVIGARRRKRKKKAGQPPSPLKQAAAAGAAIVGLVVVIFALYRLGAWINRPTGETDKLTWNAYQQLKAGVLLEELETQFGRAARVRASTVAEAFRDGQGDIDGMTTTYEVKHWCRWSNKTAKLFAGARERGGTLEVAALGYIDHDPATKGFASGWTLLPISAQLEVGARPPAPAAGQRVGVPRLAAFELLHPGMSAEEVIAAVGPPTAFNRGSSTPSGGKTTNVEQWIYRADRSADPDILPRLVAGSVGAGARGPLAAVTFLAPRPYGWTVQLKDQRVMAITPIQSLP